MEHKTLELLESMTKKIQTAAQAEGVNKSTIDSLSEVLNDLAQVKEATKKDNEAHLELLHDYGKLVSRQATKEEPEDDFKEESPLTFEEVAAAFASKN